MTLNQQAWPSMNYWVNYPKFMVSLLKAVYGNASTKENDWGYGWLPKIDGNYSWMYIFDDMYKGSSMRVGGKEPVFFFSSRRRHTRFDCDWSSDVCSSD